MKMLVEVEVEDTTFESRGGREARICIVRTTVGDVHVGLEGVDIIASTLDRRLTINLKRLVEQIVDNLPQEGTVKLSDI